MHDDTVTNDSVCLSILSVIVSICFLIAGILLEREFHPFVSGFPGIPAFLAALLFLLRGIRYYLKRHKVTGYDSKDTKKPRSVLSHGLFVLFCLTIVFLFLTMTAYSMADYIRRTPKLIAPEEYETSKGVTLQFEDIATVQVYDRTSVQTIFQSVDQVGTELGAFITEDGMQLYVGNQPGAFTVTLSTTGYETRTANVRIIIR